MPTYDKAKVAAIIKRTEHELQIANRRLKELEKRGLETPARKIAEKYLHDKKLGKFKFNENMTVESALRMRSEIVAFTKAKSSTAQGYKDIVRVREKTLSKVVGEKIGKSASANEKFYTALGSVYFQRAKDAGLNSDIIIRFVHEFSKRSKSKDKHAASQALKRFLAKVEERGAGQTAEQYADALIAERYGGQQ